MFQSLESSSHLEVQLISSENLLQNPAQYTSQSQHNLLKEFFLKPLQKPLQFHKTLVQIQKAI